MDLDHYFSGDVSASPVGDMATVSDIIEGQQRLLRRILTPPGDYIQNPSYGVGAGAYVGATTAELEELRSKIIEACAKEDTVVAPTPEPIVTLKSTKDELYCAVQYVDVTTQTTQNLSFNTGNV